MDQKITVEKTTIATNDLIAQYLPADYADAYQLTFISNTNLAPDDIQHAFWSEQPRFVAFLFKLRNKIVRAFGLEAVEENSAALRQQWIASGESARHVYETYRTDETVVKMDDKHLLFFMSVKIAYYSNNRQSLTAATVVHFHNLFERFYFIVIRPFHGILVKIMLKHLIKTRYQ